MGEQNTDDAERTIKVIVNSNLPDADKLRLVGYVKPGKFVVKFYNVSTVTIEKSTQPDHYIITTKYVGGTTETKEGNFIDGGCFNYNGQYFIKYSDIQSDFTIYKDSRALYSEWTYSDKGGTSYYNNKGNLMSWEKIEKLAQQQELERQKTWEFYSPLPTPQKIEFPNLPKGARIRADYQTIIENALAKEILEMPNDRKIRMDHVPGWDEELFIPFIDEYAKRENFKFYKETWGSGAYAWYLKI